LGAFDAAFRLLHGRGAKRFFFAGGRYADLDEWVLQLKAKERGGRAYSDEDFVKDISSFLGKKGNGPARPVQDSFVRVPDRGSLQYLDAGVPKKVMDMLGNSLCCVVHDKNDLTKDDLLNATVFIHGKERQPKVVQIGPRYFITPGRLTGAADQTCGLLAVDGPLLRFSAFTLDGKALIDGQELSLERRTKLAVK
jgi:hypothetical protein